MRLAYSVLAAALLAGGSAVAEIYVPEGEPGTVLHLNDEFKVVGRITGLDNIHGMSGAPGRGILIAGSLSELAPGSMEKPASVSEDEHAAHHGGGEKKYDGEGSLVSLIDVESHEILRQIKVPGIVHHVEVSADEKYAVVTHPTLDAVSVIDLDSGKVTATITTGPIVEYAVADPQSGHFFVSNSGNNTISEVDPEAGFVVRNFKLQGPPNHLQLDADSRQLFVSESDVGKVSVINVDDGTVLNSYDIGGTLHGVAGDSDAIWSSARERDRVVRIDRTTGQRIEAEIGPEPYHMALMDGALLVSSADEPVLWVLDPETLDLRDTIPTKDTAHQFVHFE